MPTRYVYLHGFASGPASTKARLFRERIAAAGFEITVPALDEGDFTGLTVTRQLEVVRREVGRAPGPVRLVGSSMGGYLAALFASSGDPRVESLVLMAPAFDMQAGWRARYGEARLADWRRLGALPTFHYAHGEERPIGYGLYEDMGRHDPDPPVRVPALVFMGRRDDVVDPASVARWAEANPAARLVWLESGHELTDQVETIWALSAEFLGIARR
ncbi:MAG: alpha/beta hydrolase [Candidatus Rokuibacteriota bacterium]